MRKIILALLGALVVPAAVVFVMRVNMIYLPGTTVNGVDVSFQSKDTVWYDMKLKLPTAVTVVVDGKGFNMEALEYSEPPWLTTNLKEYFTIAPIDFVPVYTIKQSFIDSILVYTQASVVDASISKVDGKWVLNPESCGYDITLQDIESELANGDLVINLDEHKVFPKVTAHSLEEKFNEISWVNDFSVTYTDGTELSLVDMVSEDLVFTLDEAYIDEMLSSMDKTYNTKRDAYTFLPTNATEYITVQRGKWSTFGKQLNKSKEKKWLLEQIESRSSHSNREPYTTGYDELTDSYVEISIEDQHLWYYMDGMLKGETDIVTGHLNKHDTPRGVYYMSECLRDRTLRGPGYASFVSYWMRLTNSGIGLHDATWRSKFGNNIYTYNGSHGCINLPKSFATELFKDSYVGMPVVIY